METATDGPPRSAIEKFMEDTDIGRFGFRAGANGIVRREQGLHISLVDEAGACPSDPKKPVAMLIREPGKKKIAFTVFFSDAEDLRRHVTHFSQLAPPRPGPAP